MPQDWIGASRLEFGPQDWDLRGGMEKKKKQEKEEEEEKEKIPHLFESIGHRPFRGRCPCSPLNFKHNLLRQGTGTADHLTLLRLLSHSIPLQELVH